MAENDPKIYLKEDNNGTPLYLIKNAEVYQGCFRHSIIHASKRESFSPIERRRMSKKNYTGPAYLLQQFEDHILQKRFLDKIKDLER